MGYRAGATPDGVPALNYLFEFHTGWRLQCTIT
jgi:hypothetical protein